MDCCVFTHAALHVHSNFNVPHIVRLHDACLASSGAVPQQVDEAVPLLVAQDKNPVFHKVVSGLKAVHPPRNPMGLRVQPLNLTKAKQEAAPLQQVSSSCTPPVQQSFFHSFWILHTPLFFTLYVIVHM